MKTCSGELPQQQQMRSIVSSGSPTETPALGRSAAKLANELLENSDAPKDRGIALLEVACGFEPQ